MQAAFFSGQSETQNYSLKSFQTFLYKIVLIGLICFQKTEMVQIT